MKVTPIIPAAKKPDRRPEYVTITEVRPVKNGWVDFEAPALQYVNGRLLDEVI